jgi:hypothetical protein
MGFLPGASENVSGRKMRFLKTGKTNSERIAVLRCCSAAVVQSERGERVKAGG